MVIRNTVLALCLATAAGADHAAGSEPKPVTEQPQTKARRTVRIRVAKDTTYLTEPLRPDGSVDYAAAVDRRLREGVQPDQNAAIPLWQAMGPADIPAQRRAAFFQRLGTNSLPEKGLYVRRFSEFIPQKGDEAHLFDPAIDELRHRLQESPWTGQQFPLTLAAAWINANERPLAILFSGLERPHCYVPVVDTLLSQSLYKFASVRILTDVLRSRAMLRMGQGQTSAALDDLLACYRISRHVCRPFIVDRLLAMAREADASRSTAFLAFAGHLTVKQVRRFQEELKRLPPMVELAETIDWGERLFVLDYVTNVVRKASASRGSAPASADPADPLKWDNALLDSAADPSVDWNEALRLTNIVFDRAVQGLKSPSIRERIESMRRMERWETRLKAGEAPAELPPRISSQVGAATLKAVASAIVSPRTLTALAQSDAERSVRFDLARLALALAAHHADHGAYPATLDALRPPYLSEIPRDVFSGGLLRYRLEGDAYLLYSVGRNGLDDGGRNDASQPPSDKKPNDVKDRRVADDIAVGKIP